MVMGHLFSQIHIEGLCRYMAPKRNSETTFIIKKFKSSPKWRWLLWIWTFSLFFPTIEKSVLLKGVGMGQRFIGVCENDFTQVLVGIFNHFQRLWMLWHSKNLDMSKFWPKNKNLNFLWPISLNISCVGMGQRFIVVCENSIFVLGP